MKVNLVEFLKLLCTSNIFRKRFVQWLARQTRYQKVWVRDLAWPCAMFLSKTLYSHSASQYLSNCAPTPPLCQQQLIDCKIGLMLGRGRGRRAVAPDGYKPTYRSPVPPNEEQRQYHALETGISSGSNGQLSS